MEGDLQIHASLSLDFPDFNPLPPHGGRLVRNFHTPDRLIISIHSLRMEGDVKKEGEDSDAAAFQSTPSAWRETELTYTAVNTIYISIHSLRMEGDAPLRSIFPFSKHFNPLPPHGGRHFHFSGRCSGRHFNPLPPHGGRRL